MLESYHVVRSETFNQNVPTGKCLVKGHVYDPSSSKGIENVLVATLDKVHSDVTDTSGAYNFLLDINDTSIFAFKSQFAEEVIWKHNFKDQHIVEIDFYLTEDYGMIEVDKPVIYMYSDKPLNVNLQLDFKSDLVFSYPEYKQGWNVQIDASGMVHEGKNYPYLFWEGETNNLPYITENDQYEGFLIKTDTAVVFLENCLTKLGFNNTESTDFITYWAPRMIQKEYAFIQFTIDDLYDERIAKLKISPKPDNIKRVFMLYSLYDNEPVFDQANLSEQSLSGLNRNGFTLLEWGGAEQQTVPNYEKLVSNH